MSMKGTMTVTSKPPKSRTSGWTTKRIPGYVWCDSHAMVHEDNNDPYGYGVDECNAENHRAVYVRARPGEEF